MNISMYKIPFRDIVDKRTLQYDWTRGTTGHTQLKVVVSDPIPLWWLYTIKCNGAVFEIYMDQKFQRLQEGLNCESLAYEAVT